MTLEGLIRSGEYDLAAYRLLYGAVRARLDPCQPPEDERESPPGVAGGAASRRRREVRGGG